VTSNDGRTRLAAKPTIISQTPETSLVGSISHAWRALRHRNFQLFFFGQSISLIGTWMTRLATTWLVYRLTHSALLLGIVTFAGQIVSFAVGPFAGVWVERLNRRKLLVWTQAAAAFQSLAMAVLTLAHIINLSEIIALATLQGLINAFDMPARQSFHVQMVEDRADLSNAIAINSSMANGARLIGPAIAGLVIAAIGEGGCFPDRWPQLLCRDRIFATDAHQARQYPQERDPDARSNSRGLGLCP
jgi:MFS family permease